MITDHKLKYAVIATVITCKWMSSIVVVFLFCLILLSYVIKGSQGHHLGDEAS